MPSSVKQYVQNTITSDIVVGVHSIGNNGDAEINFWFIPTICIEMLAQKSISTNKIPMLKNNWYVLERCKDERASQEIVNQVRSTKNNF